MDIEPPDNFRDISVIPQAADLSVGYKPFLRVNVINRRYRDLEHYLDVQFRLLREDCVLPLREGVVQLRKDYGNLAMSGCSRYKTTEDVTSTATSQYCIQHAVGREWFTESGLTRFITL